ncbi:MAG: tetratricopeptide repeat protein [Candidatus Pacebacteria bacterium]|nr:tetratricopeptide repeat protein [Candidatus Paceibacterota bacterium]
MTKRIAAITALVFIVLMFAFAGAAFAARKQRQSTTNYIEPWSCMQLYKVYEDSCMTELYEIAHRYLNDKKYDQAIVRFSQILTMKEFTLVYANRGTTYALKGDYKRARPDMVRALDLDPKRAESWFNLARVDYELKRYDDAVDSANVAIDLKPGVADFHDLRAMIHKAMNQTALAEADTRRAWDIREADEAKIIRDRANAR